jgi:hypothetical protein
VALAKKLNRDEKQAMKVGRLANFLRQYNRKAQRGAEPNDRGYDRRFESAVKRMSADEFDRLIRDDVVEAISHKSQFTDDVGDCHCIPYSSTLR